MTPPCARIPQQRRARCSHSKRARPSAKQSLTLSHQPSTVSHGKILLSHPEYLNVHNPKCCTCSCNPCIDFKSDDIFTQLTSNFPQKPMVAKNAEHSPRWEKKNERKTLRATQFQPERAERGRCYGLLYTIPYHFNTKQYQENSDCTYT